MADTENTAAQRRRRVTASAVSEERRQTTALITGAASTFGFKPQNAGLYVRISDDRFGEERGVTRQTEDGHTFAGHIGWKIGKTYCENDTSAYRKRKTTLPDGSVAWRVFRPEFRQMLDDLYHGRIDGIIVVDQDRLLRQPRDLEDLIDIVEYTHRPVTGITSQINLMTSEGRAMARMMAAVAVKSSEDTARRVSRAKLEDAVEGKARLVRRFGWTMAGEIIPEEKEAAQKAAAIVLKTGSWHVATTTLQLGDVPPVKGGLWNEKSVRAMLLSPTIAGIALYRGVMRPGGGKPNAKDPAADAIKDPQGEYIKNGLTPILDVKDWEVLCARVKDKAEGKPPGIPTTKKYLLSGILRCANVREDGTVCGTPMIGTLFRRKRTDEPKVIYRCPGRTIGGCGGIHRLAEPVDELVTDLLFRHLRRKAPRTKAPAATVPIAADSPEAEKLARLRQRAAAIRQGYSDGDETVTDETFFSTLPKMEAEIKALAAKVEAQALPTAPQYTAEEVIKEWEEADDIAGKRAILARYLIAVKVAPSATRGRAPLDHNSITPVWKKIGSTTTTP